MSTLKVVLDIKCVYVFIFLFLLLHLIDRFFLRYFIKPKNFTLHFLTSNVKINGICMRHSKCNIRMT